MHCHMLLWRYGATPSPRHRARAEPGWFARVWLLVAPRPW